MTLGAESGGIQLCAREASSPLGVDIALTKHFSARLEKHLLAFRPLLPAAEGSTILFPGPDKRKFALHEMRARLRLFELMSHTTITRG